MKGDGQIPGNKDFPGLTNFLINISAVRVYDGYLYVAGTFIGKNLHVYPDVTINHMPLKLDIDYDADGLSATAFPSGVRNTPVEINEAIAPIVVWRKEYRRDSGGPGRFRGGLGQVMEVESLEGAPFAISSMFDRVEHPARCPEQLLHLLAVVRRVALGEEDPLGEAPHGLSPACQRESLHHAV